MPHSLRRSAPLVAGALLLLAGAAPLVGQAAPGTRLPEPLRSEIRRLIDSSGVASVTVAVARDGAVLWEEGFGYADHERRIPATPTTLYSLASISKPFTATAVMRLVQAGRVNLDRPVDEYLGGMRLTGLAGDRADATVRRVLSHTAGLPLHYRFFYAGDSATPDVPQTIERYGRIMFPPGEVYEYSNLGFGILGELVAHVSGMPYETFLRDSVLRPLGLRTTTVSTGAGLANSAVRYDDHHRPIPYYDFDHRGASAVYSSADELLRFGMFNLKQRPRGVQAAPIADSTIDLMQHVATPGDTARGYGLGWGIDTDFGVRRIQHTGGMPGVATILALYPAERVVVVVLSNQSTGLPFRIASDVAAAVLPPAYDSGRVARRAAPAAPPRPFVAPAELRGEWRGTVRTYEGAIPMSVRVDSTRVLVRWASDTASWLALDNANYRGSLLGGSFAGTMPTTDARRVAHVIGLHLLVRNDTMCGWAAAEASTETNDYSLSSYAALTRVASGVRGAGHR